MHGFGSYLSATSYDIISSEWDCTALELIKCMVMDIFGEQDTLRLKWV